MSTLPISNVPGFVDDMQDFADDIAKLSQLEIMAGWGSASLGIYGTMSSPSDFDIDISGDLAIGLTGDDKAAILDIFVKTQQQIVNRKGEAIKKKYSITVKGIEYESDG